MMYEVRTTKDGCSGSISFETHHDRGEAVDEMLEMNRISDDEMVYFLVEMTDEEYAERQAAVEEAAAVLRS